MLEPCALEIFFGAAGRSVCHRARLAHAGRVSKRPHEPVGIAPFRLALQDEGLGAEDQLIAGPQVGDLARLQLERCGLGVDARLAQADDGIGRRAITRTGTGSPPAGV